MTIDTAPYLAYLDAHPGLNSANCAMIFYPQRHGDPGSRWMTRFLIREARKQGWRGSIKAAMVDAPKTITW